MEFIPMHIKLKRIDESRMFDDPIKIALETFLNPLNENLELEATTSATPLIFAAVPTSMDIQVTEGESKKNIIKLLSEQLALRNINRLIYTHEKTEVLQAHSQGLNINLEEGDKATVAPYSKSASGIGFVEFAITYDNQIFFAAGEGGAEKQHIPAYGTLLKAVGCMQLDEKVIIEGGDVTYEKVENIIKYISVHNTFFAVHPDNIAVSLFVLEQLGLDLSASKVIVPNKSAKLIHEIKPDCCLNIRGEIQEASFYLDERRFPGAKVMARETNLTILDKMTELFYSIDDEILSKRSEKIIKEVELEKYLLKLNIIKLIRRDLFSKEEEATNLDEVLIQSKLQVENTTNNQYVAINKIINSFKESHIDLSFLTQEILYLLSFKLQKGGLTDVEKEGLDTWAALSKSMPARRFDLEDKNFYSLIRFYDENPIKTCMALLKDYAKGEGWFGAIVRIFSGAWNRHYKDSVNKVLLMDKNKEFPDNLNIDHIFARLVESGLVFKSDAANKSRLRKILLFCARLNGEEESLKQSVAPSQIIFFPPYVEPTARFSFLQGWRQASHPMYSREPQALAGVGNTFHAEAMVDASTWRATDEDANVTQQTSMNTTQDESFEGNGELPAYRQDISPGEASFALGVSDSSSLNEPASEKMTLDSDAENKLLTKTEGSPPSSRPDNFINRNHSRSPSLYFVSAPSSYTGFFPPNAQEKADSSDEPLYPESFSASL